MDRTEYIRLRAFAASALGDRLPARPDPAADLDRAHALLGRATLTGAEHAACELVAFAAALAPWPPAAEWPEPDAEQRARLAGAMREAARRLAAHLPERQAAELERAADEATRGAAPAAPPGTPEPSRQARRLARLRALGGDRKRIAGQWQTVGERGAFGALVAEERAAGRRPFDAKGVRRDIQAAAELERAGKAAGPFDTLAR